MSRRASSFALLQAGLFATPAAALWLLGGAARPRRWAAALALLPLGALAAVLLIPVRWPAVSLLWAGYVVTGTLAVALGGRDRSGEREPPADGWASRSLRALLLVVFVMPLLVAFARLVGLAAVGGLLARVDPEAVDPRSLFAGMLAAALWAVPVGIAFVVASMRRGRLRGAGDIGRAALAWLALLLAFELGVRGALGALRTQMLATLDRQSLAGMQPWLVQGAFVAVLWWLALDLAFGPGGAMRRLGRAAALLGLGLVNASLLFGLGPSLQFALGRFLERSSEPARALGWYGKSLVGRSSPALESYLQHRIGLLHYKLGDEDRASDAFRLVQTSRDANPELVAEASYYLDRLELVPAGRRVVLPGVESATERRDAYCAPNTLALVFRHWGRRLSPGDIGEEVALIAGGTRGSAIRAFCERWGLEHVLVPLAGLGDLEWLVDHGVPALVYVPGHVLAVFGYDRRLGTVITYDTATWDIWVDQPVDQFLELWGQDDFQLGVVLPRELEAARRDEVLGRFDPARSRAAWHDWLGIDADDWDEKEAQLVAALAADPSYFLASFRLDRCQTSPYVRRHRQPALLAAAARAIDRPHAPVEVIAPGLASALLGEGRYPEVLDLAERLERRGIHRIRAWAGLAAARSGDLERASFYLADGAAEEDDCFQAVAALTRARAEIALGRPTRAAEALKAAAGILAGDDLLQVVAAAEGLGPGPGPGFLEEVYRNASERLDSDLERELRLGELSLRALEVERGRERRARLQQARRAAVVAAGLATTDEERARAAALERRVVALVTAEGRDEGGEAADVGAGPVP